MELMCLAADRKELVDAINTITGGKMKYQGPPSYAYKWEELTVLRDGTLVVEDVNARREMLQTLTEQHLIENTWDEERETLTVSFPMEGHTATSLVNLVSLFYTKGTLINKAIQTPRAFEIADRLMEALAETPPQTPEDFLSTWERVGGMNATRGILFSKDTISLIGFPPTEDADWVKAYTDLGGKINILAQESKYIRLKREPIENEKYAFRVWLIRLGSDGNEYKTSRKLLLSHLSGHTAFRTEEQKEAHKLKYQTRRMEVTHEES